MSDALRFGLIGGYALATFLAFPQRLGEGVLDLGLGMAPLAAALLILALGSAGRGGVVTPRRGAALGLLAGVLAHAAVLYWIYVVTVFYGQAAPPVGIVAVLALATFIGAFTALFGAGLAGLAARRLDGPFAVAALWTVVDHLRGFAFTGFPWATLGYAWHANTPLGTYLPVTGVYGLSFAAALLGAAGADAVRGRGRRALVAGVAVLALHGVGLVLAPGKPDPGAERLRIAVLQGNIQQGVKWSPEWADRTWEIYASLTRAAANQGAEVVVWPETAVPGSPDTSNELRESLAELARRNEVTLVVGAVGIDGYDRDQQRPVGDLRFFDSAVLVSPAGELEDRYDKSHLVPFGEYVPLRALLGRFVKALATGVTSGDVSEGVPPRALALARPGGGPRVSAGVPICYELLFPDLVRRFTGDGARVLLGITNDAWYGRTGAPHQFLVMTAVRAAESRTWLARAANTGVSAFIDERGRVREQTRIFERDFLVRDVPLRAPDERGTFYVRHGDRFAQACWLGVALVALRGAWIARRERG